MSDKKPLSVLAATIDSAGRMRSLFPGVVMKRDGAAHHVRIKYLAMMQDSTQHPFGVQSPGPLAMYRPLGTDLNVFFAREYEEFTLKFERVAFKPNALWRHRTTQDVYEVVDSVVIANYSRPCCDCDVVAVLESTDGTYQGLRALLLDDLHLHFDITGCVSQVTYPPKPEYKGATKTMDASAASADKITVDVVQRNGEWYVTVTIPAYKPVEVHGTLREAMLAASIYIKG